MLCCSPLGELLSPSLAKCIDDVVTCTYLPLMIMIALALIIVAYDYRSFKSVQISNIFMMEYMFISGMITVLMVFL